MPDQPLGEIERIAQALEAIAATTSAQGLLFALRHDQQWLVDRVVALTEMVLRLTVLLEQNQPGRNRIQVAAIDLKKERHMSPDTDHSVDLQLPSASDRALLQIANPRNPDGTPFTGAITWTSSDDSQLPLEATPDTTDADGNRVAQVFANTPLDAGTGVVTAAATGFKSCDIKVTYSDPPVGHFAITGAVVPE